MIIKRQSVKNALVKAFVACSLDGCFERMSFIRRNDSLLYRRTCADFVQEVEFYFDLRPKYKPTAVAHILPHIRFEFQPMVPIIAAMASNHPLARVAKKRFTALLFRNQINNIAPYGQRSNYWYLYDVDNANECVESMKVFVETWCFPFMEEYSTIEAIIKGYERSDERLHSDKQFDLCIAACYIFLELPQKALEILERHFGSPGLRREYSQAFEYVLSKMR
ncbi:MAG: hypothetical protein ABFD91_08990 [Anaerohalosphaeraceae bacterium]